MDNKKNIREIRQLNRAFQMGVNFRQRLLSVTIILMCSAVFCEQVKADTQGGYSHDSQVNASNPDWMSALPDTAFVGGMSIPGTHDTMAFYGGDSVQCQSLPLGTQLQAGIRALDIRLVADGRTLYVYHGIIYQQANLDDVLTVVTTFLKDHPREAIFMRIKKENSGDAGQFETALRGYLGDPNYKYYFWTPLNTQLVPTNSIPLVQMTGTYNWSDFSGLALGAVRGKIVILQDFSSTSLPPVEYGISWNSLKLQYNYHLNTNWDLYNKWTDIKTQIDLVNSSNQQEIYANFLSGSGGSFPYFVASGKSSPQTGAPQLLTGLTTPGWASSYPDFPRVSCFIGICSIAFMGTNEPTSQKLRAYINAGTNNRGQITFADFPGGDFINNIIKFNKGLR